MRRWLALALLAGAALASPLHAATSTLSFNQFSGLNTDDSPLTLTEGQTPDSENVVTDDGPGLSGRKGFISFSTEPCTQMWEFPLTSGTRYLVCHSGNFLKAATSDGIFDDVISTLPATGFVAGSSLGDLFYFANTVDGIKYWSPGVGVFVASTTLHVDKLVTWSGRLAAAGNPAAPRTIYLSKFTDGNTWTAPATPSDADAAQITVSGALDEPIQALYSSFRNTLVWFKQSGFGALLGSRRSDFANWVYSDRIGISSAESVQDCGGLLRWLAPNREIWEFDGLNVKKISEDVDNITQTLTQGDSTTRQQILTTQTDFSPGTVTGGATYTQNSGSVEIASQAAKSQVDTSSSNFAAGTLTNTSGSETDGSLTLSLTRSMVDHSESFSQLGYNDSNGYYQQFTAGASYVARGMQIYMGQSGATLIGIFSDSGGSPNAPLAYGETPDVSFASGAWQQATFNVPLNLVNGTKYWAAIFTQTGCLTAPTTVLPYGSNFVGASPFKRETHVGCSPPVYTLTTVNKTLDFRIDPAYNTSGDIVSRTFDVGVPTTTWAFAHSTFSALGTFTAGTTTTFEIQASNDGTNFSTLASVTNNTVPSSTLGRYLRYKASLSSDGLLTPFITDITLNVTGAHQKTGVYTTPVISVGTSISAWSALLFSNTATAGTIGFEFNASTASTIGAFNPANWTAVTANSIPVIATAPFAAARLTFTATTGTGTLSVSDISLNWLEGSTVKAASAWLYQRYWLSAAINATTNNRVLVYDKKQQWQRYSGINATAMSRYGTRTFFSNTNGVFEAENGYTDNGTDITSYYRTPTRGPAGLDLFAKYQQLMVTTDNSDATLSTSFRPDLSTNINFGSVQMNTTSGLQNIKLPFSVGDTQQSRFIDLKWAVSGSTFWRILNANLYFKPDAVPQ